MDKNQHPVSRSTTAGLAGSNRPVAPGGEDAQVRIDILTARLRRRDDELAEAQSRLAEMESMIRAGEGAVAALQSEVARLTTAVHQGGGAHAHVTKPTVHDVTDELPKHPTLRYATRSLDKITHLCIHHSATGGSVPIENVARFHIEDRGWAGIGYHFYIKPDGEVYQTNRLETVSYHVSNNNGYAVGVCVSGDFTYAPPASTQVEAAAHLVAWLMQELSVPDEHVLGHKEFPANDTSCPGETWLKKDAWKTTLLELIRAQRAGSVGPVRRVGHYLLFWQKPDAWAQQDWQAAEAYVGRFRPTAGFSVDDAMTARYVTIVGGAAGVSIEAEQQLRSAGCQVERLAGVDFTDTKRMLDALAQNGQRFQTLAG